jgi:hypothetical protein
MNSQWKGSPPPRLSKQDSKSRIELFYAFFPADSGAGEEGAGEEQARSLDEKLKPALSRLRGSYSEGRTGFIKFLRYIALVAPQCFRWVSRSMPKPNAEKSRLNSIWIKHWRIHSRAGMSWRFSGIRRYADEFYSERVIPYGTR